jgi:pimeloyl-ACP methyl ester carboxylesterase
MHRGLVASSGAEGRNKIILRELRILRHLFTVLELAARNRYLECENNMCFLKPAGAMATQGFLASNSPANRSARLFRLIVKTRILPIVFLVFTDFCVYAQDPKVRSEVVRIDSSTPGLKLALHHELAISHQHPRLQNIVLFAEGSAVPTSGNAAFKINGISWMDNLAQHGFDVWSLDYLGYGESGRYAASDVIPGRASDCASQLEQAARFILKQQRGQKLSVIGDSFGSLVAGLFATRVPELLDKLILFAPVTPVSASKAKAEPEPKTKYDFVTADDLWQLYLSWLPKGQFAGLSRAFFINEWGSKYLDSDATSRERNPPSVMVPAGPDLDSADIENGQFPYDPGRIKAPTLIIFGEWDLVATEDGGKRLFDLLTGAQHKRRIIIGRGTHILQLESVRFELYREVQTFLESHD